MKTCLLIYNPNSGKKEIQLADLLQQAKTELLNYRIVTYETTGDSDCEKIKSQIRASNPALILAAGGDGTIKMVCKAIIRKKITIGVIPTGSANGLAKCIGINDLEEAWESIAEMKISSIDALKIDQELCIHLADFGLNASLVDKFEKEGTRGMAGYAKNYFQEIFNGQQGRFTLEFQGEKTDLESKMLVIGNGDQYGTGAKVNSKGKMNDGLFEVISLNPETLFDYLDGTLAMFQGNSNQMDIHECWQGKTCRIHNYDRLPFQIDGEMMSPLATVDVEILPQAFDFVVGKNFLT